MKDALCDIDAHYAKLLFHGTRSYGSMVVMTSLTILAHQSRSAQGRVHYIRVGLDHVWEVTPGQPMSIFAVLDAIADRIR